MITQEIKDKIKVLADQNPEEEICGFVLDDGTVLPRNNLADDPTEAFIISYQAVTAAKRLGKIIALYHTHHKDTHGSDLSPTDIQNAQKWKIPFLLYHINESFPALSWDYFDPLGIDPFPMTHSGDPSTLNFYLNWKWVWGRADCYSLMKSYYKGVLNIDLPDIIRSISFEEYKVEGWNRYREGMISAGFKKLPQGSPMKLHDVVLMNLNGVAPHHSGIIVDPVQKHMLHHDRAPRLSRVVVFGGYWGDCAAQGGLWRHESLC
jgi:proteasome lid subunit RPN8/RPN11